MFLAESSFQLPKGVGVSLELGLHGAVEAVPDEPPDPERSRLVPDKLPEVHSLNPATEPEPYANGDHARLPSDVK